MKLYEYQRSRSFTNLGTSHSISIFSNFISSITTEPTEAKFYVALPLDEGTEVSSNDLDHLTKMAATPMHGKNL